jgi:hypothetical protein
MMAMAVTTQNRFKKLVHYVCSQCADNPSKLGATKLNKSLWLSDLRAYYATGQPITEARYVKRQYGPVPSSIVPVLRELQQEGALSMTMVGHFGKPKREFTVVWKQSGDFLDDVERKIVDDTVKSVTETHTAKSISDWSHDHIWQAAEDGEELPHFTVFANPDEVTDEEMEWANLKLEGNI